MKPRTLIPYLIALFVAGMVIAGGALFVTKTHVGLAKRFEAFKADLLARKKAGKLPPEWQGKDIEGLDLEHSRMHLPADAQLWLDTANALESHRAALIAGVLVLCLGVAAGWHWRCGRGKVTRSPAPTASPAGPVR